MTALPNDEAPSAADNQSAAWCIPLLAFYAFGVLVSMVMTWATARFSKRLIWPPADFRKDNRSDPLYQLVLCIPVLLWLAVVAVVILFILGPTLFAEIGTVMKAQDLCRSLDDDQALFETSIEEFAKLLGKECPGEVHTNDYILKNQRGKTM